MRWLTTRRVKNPLNKTKVYFVSELKKTRAKEENQLKFNWKNTINLVLCSFLYFIWCHLNNAFQQMQIYCCWNSLQKKADLSLCSSDRNSNFLFLDIQLPKWSGPLEFLLFENIQYVYHHPEFPPLPITRQPPQLAAVSRARLQLFSTHSRAPLSNWVPTKLFSVFPSIFPSFFSKFWSIIFV